MLGKLMKYEFKSTARTFLPIYGALLATALVTRLMMWGDAGSVSMSGNFAYNLISVLVVFLFIALLVATFALSLIVTLQRYYKNLLGEEGYLSMTLPVKPWQHIASKLVVSSVWYIASSVVAMLSFFILMMSRNFFSEFTRVFGQVFSMIDWNFDTVMGTVEVIVLLVVSMACGILMLYASMSLGQLTNKSRKLASFGWFLGLMFAMQMLTGFLTRAFTGMLGHISFHGAAWYSIILCLAFSAAFFFLSNYMLSKKLNLE